MTLTVGQLKKMLSVKRDTDIVSINNMLVSYAEFDNNNKVKNTTNILIYSPGELSNDLVRTQKLESCGVIVKKSYCNSK